MAAEWNEKLLRDLLVTTKDGDWGKEIQEEGYVPYHIIRGTDFPNVRVGNLSSVPLRFLPENTVKRRTLEADDILIETAGGTRDRPTGRTLLITDKVLARFRGPVTCASFARFLRIDRSQADPRFIFWYLQNLYQKGEMSQHQVQHTGVARFQYTRFAETQSVSLPPPPEQKIIADILGTLDDKIELNRRMNATLEAIVRALFQNWFVDFDPVRAKLDGRTPAGLNAVTAALFPSHFQDSPLGTIPHGWMVKSVGEVVDCVGGGTPSTAEPKYWEGGIHHWTTPKDFSSLQAPILLDTDRKLTDAGIAKISSGLLPAGTLLLSSRAPVGYLAITAVPVAINQGFIALKCNERASNFFMLNWCQTNMAEIESRATGTTFAEISKQNFRPISVVLPPKELMAAFTAKAAPIYAQITANLRQSSILTTLRNTLLPELVSGELRVSKITSKSEKD